MAWLIYETESLAHRTPFRPKPGSAFRFHERGEEAPWTMNLREIPSGAVPGVLSFLPRHIKEPWFVTLLDRDAAHIVFGGETFTLRLERTRSHPQGIARTSSGELERLVTYGKEHGLTEGDLDIQRWTDACASWIQKYESDRIYRVEWGMTGMESEVAEQIEHRFPRLQEVTISTPEGPATTHLAEIPERDLDLFITLARSGLQRGWYALAIAEGADGSIDREVKAILPDSVRTVNFNRWISNGSYEAVANTPNVREYDAFRTEAEQWDVSPSGRNLELGLQAVDAMWATNVPEHLCNTLELGPAFVAKTIAFS